MLRAVRAAVGCSILLPMQRITSSTSCYLKHCFSSFFFSSFSAHDTKENNKFSSSSSSRSSPMEEKEEERMYIYRYSPSPSLNPRLEDFAPAREGLLLRHPFLGLLELHQQVHGHRVVVREHVVAELVQTTKMMIPARVALEFKKNKNLEPPPRTASSCRSPCLGCMRAAAPRSA